MPTVLRDISHTDWVASNETSQSRYTGCRTGPCASGVEYPSRVRVLCYGVFLFNAEMCSVSRLITVEE